MSVAQIPATPQQQHLAAVQAAQAAAYHNDLDPGKVDSGAIAAHTAAGGNPALAAQIGLGIAPSTVAYEETEDPPTRNMAYFHLISHQFSVYMTFVLVALVIAFSIVYNDTKQLRDDVANNLRYVCKDISTAILSYFALVVITGGFAALTWLTWFVKKWFRYLPIVCGMLFFVCCVALLLYNVAGTVAFGKPNSTACWQLGSDGANLDAVEAYYMVEGAMITIWVSMGLPIVLLGVYVFYHQARDLAEDFPSDRKLREMNRQERELLMVPPNPARAFRYP